MDINEIKAQDLMATKLKAFPETGKIAAADIYMMRQGIGSLLVVNDEGNLSGIITDGDLIRMRNAIQVPDKPVSHLMTKNPITVTPLTPLKSLMNLMLKHNIKHLPVVENNKAIGLVTHGRIFKKILENLP